jgi:hypothetical protein
MTQADLCVEVKVPRYGSQCYEILMALKNGKRLTVAIAITEHGVYALSQRIGELKRMGWPIQSRMVTTSGGARVAEYWMEE